jgi:exopolysaccharide biosynthesis WecB/TagA/CpsF family protein
VTLDSVDLLDVRITSATATDVLAQIERRMGSSADPLFVAFANANTLNLASTNADYRAALGRADLVLNDGIGVALAARMLNRRFPENLNGTDFLPRLLTLAADRGWRLFLLGGEAGTAKAAADNLRGRIPNLQVVGADHGYLTPKSDREVVSRIRAGDAQVVLVGMGNPAQEYWLAANLGATGAQIGIGVGAFLDFAAGRVARAPGWLRRARLEWVWRMVIEPRRLWRRYLVGNPLFLYRAARYTRRMRYQGGAA